MHFKNPKLETKYPKVCAPKDLILGHNLNNYHRMMQDSLNMKAYWRGKNSSNSSWSLQLSQGRCWLLHLNAIRMWSSLESRYFSFWKRDIDTSVSFDPAGWCTSADSVVTSWFHYVLKIDSILFSSFQTRHLFSALPS